MEYSLSLDDFIKLSKNFNVIPVYKEILADIDTPLSVFLKISSPDRFNYLLESVEKGENVGRYSFIGSSQPVYIRTKKNFAEVYDKGCFL